jgi:uncharacterized protein
MYRVLSIERSRREPSWAHGTRGGGQRRASQPAEAAGAGSIPFESSEHSGRLGHRGKPAQGDSPSRIRHAEAGITTAVPGRPAGSECFARESACAGASGFLKSMALAVIGFYRSAISPSIPSSCRFYPTCSAYAFEAVSTWGLRRGLGLTLRRLGRCRPFGPYGYDPVPERCGADPAPFSDPEIEVSS